MDGLLILVIVVAAAIPLTLILLVIWHFGTRSRIERLEGEVLRLSREVGLSRVSPVPTRSQPLAETPPEIKPEPPAPAMAPPDPVAFDPWSPGKPVAKPAPAPIPMAAPRAPATGQDRPLVLSAARMDALTAWLRDNWVLAIAAVSLALAGIFFVQYGMERGLLPPPVRVLAALAFGAALVFAGEWIRRRHGDEKGATANIPSAFSGAGIVSLFGAVLAARQLYGLIGPEAAMAGFIATALLALVLGWFHGPFLAAIGLIGGTLAPFMVSSGSDDATRVYAYFAVISLLGLAIDTIRRWAWISVLSLALPTAAGLVVYADRGQGLPLILMLTLLVLAAIIIPGRALTPRHDGPAILAAVLRRGKRGWPAFPVRLAGGMMLTASAAMAVISTETATEETLLTLCLAALAIGIALWAWRAPALSDLVLPPTLALLFRLITAPETDNPLFRDFIATKVYLRLPETGPSFALTMLIGLLALISLAAGARSLSGHIHRISWAAFAVALPPAAMLTVEWFWWPASVLGPYLWALHAIALAALMTGLAVLFARRDDPEDRRRTAYAALSVMVLIPFALFALLSKGALTLSLAALIVAATALDRRFRLPELQWFVQAGCIVLGWRLFLDPGLEWAIDAPLAEVTLSFLSAIAAAAAGLWLLQGMARDRTKVFLDSGLIAFIAVFADVLLFRWLDAAFPDEPALHWAATLLALPWAAMAFVQLYRARLPGFLSRVRRVLATLAGLIAAFGLGSAATVGNPLFVADRVGGPPLLSTLAVAYALPGLILLLAGRRFPGLSARLRTGLTWAGTGFLALYALLSVRQFWQGPVLSGGSVSQGELYSYTLLMMLTGAALIWQSIAKGSVLLRRIGMTVIALTIAKVFLVDAGGLTGLTRVAAFLGLGLSLAGLAWLNRWAAGQSREAV